MARLTMEQEAREYRSMGLGSENAHPPRVPEACRRCQNWCHYYGDPDHAAMCQSADDQQQAELEQTRG